MFNFTDIIGGMDQSIASLSFTRAFDTIEPLFFFVIGIAIYSIFVFKFYRFLAKRDIFELHIEKYRHKGMHKFLHAIKTMILFPLVVFFWFIILSFLLVMISKMSGIVMILQASIALVAAVRICAYYKEDLSRDLAKMLPFALLAISILDIYDVAFQSSIEMLRSLPLVWETIFYYLVFVVLMEIALRILLKIKRHIRKPKDAGGDKETKDTGNSKEPEKIDDDKVAKGIEEEFPPPESD